jgi:hypothetical protein
MEEDLRHDLQRQRWNNETVYIIRILTEDDPSSTPVSRPHYGRLRRRPVYEPPVMRITETAERMRTRFPNMKAYPAAFLSGRAI